ncbi:MAG TPA: FliM/FliN family flagellar motor C-terminal domain-containing protein [Pirellulales bacterium]|jgi:flagellar motor switch/type III secretory pathway protein FliN|nr:FliM/FliN family flagellar motor C-terminal domain-containing protein [Pirellulales bacterium]
MATTNSSGKPLPGYTLSLLKIKVPVMVTLAAKKQTLGQITELAPGSIVAFDKPCEELLLLEAAGHKIALGEAVKVGDKFGLRVKQLVLPDEQFKTLGKKPT